MIQMFRKKLENNQISRTEEMHPTMANNHAVVHFELGYLLYVCPGCNPVMLTEWIHCDLFCGPPSTKRFAVPVVLAVSVFMPYSTTLSFTWLSVDQVTTIEEGDPIGRRNKLRGCRSDIHRVIYIIPSYMKWHHEEVNSWTNQLHTHTH